MVLLAFDSSLMRKRGVKAWGGDTPNDKMTQPIELDYGQLELSFEIKVIIYNRYHIGL